jgi:hypothetical protein
LKSFLRPADKIALLFCFYPVSNFCFTAGNINDGCSELSRRARAAKINHLGINSLWSQMDKRRRLGYSSHVPHLIGWTYKRVT